MVGRTLRAARRNGATAHRPQGRITDESRQFEAVINDLQIRERMGLFFTTLLPAAII